MDAAARARVPNRRSRAPFLAGSLSSGPQITALVDRLRELGWIEVQNIAFEYRNAENEAALGTRAAELVELSVEVICLGDS